jgi:putative ABC transport system permease protein
MAPLPRLGRRAPTLAGLAFALRRPGGRAAVPVRVTALVAVFGIAGVVAVGTFAASLDRLVHTPARYGWIADFATVDAKPHDTAAIAADPRVAAVTVGDGGSVRIDGVVTTGVALRRVSGRSPIPVLSGRLPHRPGEIALGQVDLDRMGAQVGDTVFLATVRGDGTGGPAGSRPLRVVGIVLIPPVNDDRLGTGAIMARHDLRAGHRGQLNADALVTLGDKRDAASMFRELSQRLEMTPAGVPRQVNNLAALGRLPSVLAGFLALLALVVLAHSLLLTTRRRSPDLAVLRVIGMSPRQVAAAVGVMAGTLTVIGLLLGPLLGVAVGRVVWAEVAANIGVAGDIAMPWWLALVVPAALLLTVAVALLPARRAARLSPARVLRSE